MYRLLYQDGEAPSQSYTFSTGEVTIGRSPDCQIVLKDFGISRTHARIIANEDGVRIADLKSKNGTQVNGVQVMEAVLKDGDKILLGKLPLTFSKTLEGKVVLDEARATTPMVAEGVRTTLAACALAERTGTDMPIATEMKEVLYRGKAPRAAVLDLMMRSLKRE